MPLVKVRRLSFAEFGCDKLCQGRAVKLRFVGLSWVTMGYGGWGKRRSGQVSCAMVSYVVDSYGGCAQSGYGVFCSCRVLFRRFGHGEFSLVMMCVCSGGYVWVGRVALSSGLLSSVTAVELSSVWVCSGQSGYGEFWRGG